MEEEGNVLLAPLLDNIKQQGFSIQNHVVSYFSVTDKAWIFVAKDPVPEDYIIQLSDLDQSNPTLQIKLRPLGDSPAMVDRMGSLKQGNNSFAIQPNFM